MLILYMLIFSGTFVMYMTITISLFMIAIVTLMKELKERARKKVVSKVKENEVKIPIGFYLCVSNILLILINNFLCNWVI